MLNLAMILQNMVRKFLKISTARHLKSVIVVTVIISITTTAIISYCFFWPNAFERRAVSKRSKYIIIEKSMKHIRLDLLDPNGNKESEDEFFAHDFTRGHIIDTPGCQIPLQFVNYKKKTNSIVNKLSNSTKKSKPPSCGKRAITLRKSIDEVNIIIVSIYKKYLNLTRQGQYSCCYSFLINGSRPTTPCKRIQHGNKLFLKYEFIRFKCFEFGQNNSSHVIYNDVYAFVKKLNVSSKQKQAKLAHKFNVLMIGMDSMSAARFCAHMPRTTKFMKENSWLFYRAYNKIGDNTFPNIMATLSGKNLTTISESCYRNMDSCNDLMIWSKFKEAGYVTAFGEENLELPDTFSGAYGFKKQPTDHYLRPFFRHREKLNDDKRLLCTGMVTSGTQLLDYAFDFAYTYRKDSFFGFFWSNSFSHHANSSPHRADNIFLNFFNRLLYTGVMKNTFVIFFSDHGTRFGKYREVFESYYDDRLPIFIMWTPNLFSGKFIMQSNAASYNQYRLVTPYDLYNTLVDINRISWKQSSAKESQGCKNCHSIFRPMSPMRTCESVNIEEKWCSCHSLFPLDTTDAAGVKLAIFLLNYVNSKSKKVATKPCWVCQKLSLKKIVRAHFYYDKMNTRLYYVIAVLVVPGNVTYEATISKKDAGYEMVGPSSYLSAYNGHGSCALHRRDRYFCVCKKMENCPKTL